MSKELGGKLEELIMNEHWLLVAQKPYPMFEGLWEKRDVLPTVYTHDFEEPLNEHLEIPLQGGGYIRLGKTAGENPQISVDLKYQTARGEIEQDGFIITKWLRETEGSAYPFWISYDNQEQDERMKFLARMEPEKDIDWVRIEPESKEHEVAKALCKYRKVRTRSHE